MCICATDHNTGLRVNGTQSHTSTDESSKWSKVVKESTYCDIIFMSKNNFKYCLVGTHESTTTIGEVVVMKMKISSDWPPWGRRTGAGAGAGAPQAARCVLRQMVHVCVMLCVCQVALKEKEKIWGLMRPQSGSRQTVHPEFWGQKPSRGVNRGRHCRCDSSSSVTSVAMKNSQERVKRSRPRSVRSSGNTDRQAEMVGFVPFNFIGDCCFTSRVSFCR